MPTVYDPPGRAAETGSLPLDGSGVALDAAELIEAFSAIVPVFERWVEAGLRDQGTSAARLRVLDALHCHGPLRMRDISDRLGVTARNVTALVDGLAADGLVVRTAHPTDRRATIISLTDAGAALGRDLWAGHMARAGVAFGVLTSAERSELLRMIRVLRGELERRARA